MEVRDFVQEKDTAYELGVDKIPAVAVLQEDGTDFGIRFYGIPSGSRCSSPPHARTARAPLFWPSR